MKPSEKSKNTNELIQILSSAKTPEELQAYTETLKQEHISCSFADFISEKLRERELSAADLIRNSMIQRNYGYQLLNGTRTPSRDKVLAFCLALGLDQSVIFCGQFIHAILFCSLLLRLLSFDFSLRIFLAQAGQYLDAPEPGTYSTPHTVQFLAGIAAHRFVGMICNSSTKPMNL